MKKKKNESNIHFQESFLHEIKRLKPGECLQGSVFVNNSEFPIVCAFLSSDDVKHFGIGKYPFKFDWKFRYLDDGRNELVEICLRFKNGMIMAILLDPASDGTRQFLGLMTQKRNFGIYYMEQDSRLFAGTMSRLDTETYSWSKKNLNRSKSLNRNRFQSILKLRMKSGASSDRFFVGKSESLIENDDFSDLIPFEKASAVLFPT